MRASVGIAGGIVERRILLPGLLMLGVASAAEPTAYPEIDFDTATPSVVIATAEYGDSHAMPEDCNQPLTLCMRSPYWFTLTTLQTVYGRPPPTPVIVSTFTHSALPSDTPAPKLVLLLTQADRTIMPVYAYADLTLRGDGEYFVVVGTDVAMHWLPCDIERLREPIVAHDFPDSIAITDDNAWDVKQYPDLYTRDGNKTVPRYGIRVARIREYLESHRTRPEAFNCEPESDRAR
jgi:hypothetical protein